MIWSLFDIIKFSGTHLSNHNIVGQFFKLLNTFAGLCNGHLHAKSKIHEFTTSLQALITRFLIRFLFSYRMCSPYPNLLLILKVTPCNQIKSVPTGKNSAWIQWYSCMGQDNIVTNATQIKICWEKANQSQWTHFMKQMYCCINTKTPFLGQCLMECIILNAKPRDCVNSKCLPKSILTDFFSKLHLWHSYEHCCQKSREFKDRNTRTPMYFTNQSKP